MTLGTVQQSNFKINVRRLGKISRDEIRNQDPLSSRSDGLITELLEALW